ncbi:MAG: NAD-dependent epimerase/dehydratase family protein [bacterium]
MTGPVAVTGAAGFVCANVVLHLAQRSHHVIACDVAPPPDALRRLWAEQSGSIRWVALDVAAEGGWAALDAEPVERIVHGAAITPGGPDPTPERTARVNFWGTVAGLEYARRRACRRFVFISSSGVYGAARSHRPLRETRALRPENAYALAKRSAEQFVSLYRHRYGLDACSVRLAAPYGPWERPTGVRTRMSPIFRLATAALRGEKIRVSGMQIARDWTYVDDVAAGLTHLMNAPALPFDLFNLSSGKPASLGTIVRTLRRLIPGAAIEAADADHADVGMGPADYRAPLDITRLRAAGFVPRTNLATGLARYLEWLNGIGSFVWDGESDGI